MKATNYKSSNYIVTVKEAWIYTFTHTAGGNVNWIQNNQGGETTIEEHCIDYLPLIFSLPLSGKPSS